MARPVPTRTSAATQAVFGFTPTTGPLSDRIRALKSLSPLGRSQGDKPLQAGWETGIQTYADAVWAAARTLQDAGKAQRTVTNWANVTSDVPQNAEPYDAAITTLLNAFNPENPTVQKSITKGQKGAGYVTFSPLSDMDSLLTSGINWTSAKGNAVALAAAAKNKDLVIQRTDYLRTRLPKGRSLKVDETTRDASSRWAKEDAVVAPAAPATAPVAQPSMEQPASADASTAPTAETTELTTLVTVPAEPASDASGKPHSAPPSGMPSWALPAAATVGVLGIALLVHDAMSASSTPQPRYRY